MTAFRAARRPTRGHLVLVVLATIALSVAITPVPAHARTGPAGTPSETAGPPVLDVVDQTATVPADGTFLLALDVRAVPKGSRLAIILHTRKLADRNAFSRSLFGVELPRPSVQVPGVDLDRVVTTDGAKRVYIAIGLERSGPSAPGQIFLSRGLAGPGAYPLEVQFIDGAGQQRTKIVTHLVRLPDPSDAPADEQPQPLRAAVVLPLHSPPTVGPEGRTRAPATIDEIGDVTSALAAHPDVPVTIDPTPETIEAMAREQGRSTAALTRLRRSLPGRQVLDGPYVDLSVTSWLNSGMADELSLQRARGNAVLTDQLASPDNSTWVAGAELSTDAAAQLWQLGVRRLLIDRGAFRSVGGDDATLAQPFEVGTGLATPLQALQVDPGLRAAFGRGKDPELNAFQVLAELSVIHDEDPTATRGVVLFPSQDTPVPTGFLSTLLKHMATDPLITPVTVEDLFKAVPALRADGGDGPTVATTLTPLPSPSLGDYPSHLAATRARVASATGLIGADDPLITQWQQRLLVSGSDDLSPALQEAYLVSIDRAIEGRVDAVDAPARQTVTLTAREGSIPLTLRSRLQKPIDVIVALDASPRVEFPDGDRLPVRLEPGTRQIRLRVRTRSPGDAPVTVRIVSPDGNLALASSQLTVRSTAVSGIGFVLSAGAAAFLGLWWARHWRRARRERTRGRHAAVA